MTLTGILRDFHKTVNKLEKFIEQENKTMTRAQGQVIYYTQMANEAADNMSKANEIKNNVSKLIGE